MSDKVTLSNEELIERCDKWIVDLCKDRKNWTLSVPVQFNRDPDILFTELIRRFKAALHPSESAGVKPPCFQVKANTGEIHQVKKYIIDTNGSESVWCDTWYGHHRIGQDCEWVGAGVKGQEHYELAFIPCAENDPRAIGGYTSYDGQSLCHVRELHLPVRKEGAVWVKATNWPEGRHNKVHWRRASDKSPLLIIGRNYQENIIAQFGKVYTPDELEWLDESSESPAAAGETEEQIFEQYHAIKEKIGKLGYNTFINSKEVDEYREWLRKDKYKHRLEWFEKEYPNGLYSKDNDGELFGINIMTKKFLAEADAAYEAAAAQSGKEEAVKLFQRILNQANHARNTSGIDRLPAIKRLAKQGIEIFDPNNKALED